MVTLTAKTRLQDLPSNLNVLAPVMDDEKHYWVAEEEVESHAGRLQTAVRGAGRVGKQQGCRVSPSKILAEAMRVKRRPTIRSGLAGSSALPLGYAADVEGAQFSAVTRKGLSDALARSKGVDGRSEISEGTRSWLGGIEAQLPARFWVHRDDAARQAARLLNVRGFVCGERIFLDQGVPDEVEQVFRHELVHVAQVQLARGGRNAAPTALVEDEADALARMQVAAPVRLGAHPDRIYGFLPLVMAVGFGLYILLRPSPANAPGPKDKVLPAPSPGQIVGEGISIFVVPGGAATLAGRVGLGFFGRSMIAGAATAVSLQGVGDAAQGEASSPLLYLTDAATGAVIGFVVPGGFKLIGKAGTLALDRLATVGMTDSDIKITTLLAQEAQRAPLTAEQARQILAQKGFAAQVSQWYLDKRGVIVLYRGQEIATPQILSPMSQTQGVAASQALVSKLRSLGYSDSDIASFSARQHVDLFDRPSDPPDLRGLRPGSVGIPVTGLPGIASGFAKDAGVIYTIRMPRSLVYRPEPWPLLKLEDEYTIFNEVPKGSIVQIMPANRVPALTIDGNGMLAPAPK